jgi:serine/threonine protein kinase
LVIAVDRLLGWASSGGDLAYLAPESFSDDRCSRQSDVYMLGLVFHEMLTGVNPFSEVGTHLRGDDESKHPELRRLHLAARHHLSLSILEQQAELKQQPALAAVIRNSLQADLQSRRYASATEMLADWENAKSQLDRPRVAEQPWDAVRRILREAEQSLKVGDRARYAALLADAMRINRDPRSVPDSMVVGTAYQRMVEWLTTNSQTDEAGEIAMEGYRRRKCRATCLAISKYYEAVKSPVAAAFRVEANGYGEES